MTARPVQEGYVPFRGHRVWYRTVGQREAPGKLPVLCLHGGPGATHDYLEPLEALADTGRRLIFYDQLGCGNSDQPDDPSLWTIPLYIEEVAVVRKALGLDRIHLYGQSWGGMLAMEHVLTRPSGLASLTVASSPGSMQQWVREANRLRDELPPEVQQVLLKHEEAGTTDDQAYQDAMMVFYRRHLCRMDPWPECLKTSFAKVMRNPQVYYTMNGPSEFYVVGRIRDWDIVNRLGEIRLPTLITSGRYDESTPALTEVLHKGIAGSEWVLFEESSHSAHLEETERYLKVLSGFWERVERK